LATDLAVLAPGAMGLPPVDRGDPEVLRPGQWVAAIGNPYGMDHSITVGVISALGRHNLPPGGPKYADFIQSDVAVNPGNSGGPLVDDRGRVIGLNTAIIGQGLAFSARIDMVQTVIDRLLAEGEFVRGFAGLIVRKVTFTAARESGFDMPRGARVKGVVQDGPAARAGLQPGDIIYQFGERRIDTSDALPWLIAATRPGEKVDLRVARGRERLTLALTIGAAPQ
ncbi:MAG: trypsin-like peptidase domain-containing protein, partial [Myxococcales bacterium]|nr:trypsin-like peptidase domain-containing protein [Myxococcales bacterium]